MKKDLVFRGGPEVGKWVRISITPQVAIPKWVTIDKEE